MRLRPAPHTPHADPELFAQGHAAEPFRELAAGPAGQLAGALCLSGKGRPSSRSRSISRPRWPWSIRSISSSSPTPTVFRSPIAPNSRPELAPYLRARSSPGRCFAAYLAAIPREAASTRQFPGRSQRQPAEDDPLCHPHGAGRADARRRRWQLAAGSCRDSAWLLDPDPAPSRPRRALRLRLSDPASSPTSIRSTGRRGTQNDFTDLHAWAEVYLPGAGWIGFDATSGMFCAARAISRSPPRRITARRRRSRARSDRREVEFAFEMSVTRIREAPRITKPFSDEAWARLDALGEQVDADLKAQDVRLTMGGEPTFVSDRRFRSAGMEHRRGRPDQARPRRRPDPPAARRVRAGRPAALRPGQMVSRRKPAALGLLRSIGARTACRSGKNADSDRRRSETRAAPGRRHRRRRGASRRRTRGMRTRRRSDYVMPAYRGSGHWLQQGSRAAGQCRSRRFRSWPIPRSARAWRGCSSAGSTRRRGFVLPVQRWNADAASRPALEQRALAAPRAAICS